MFFEDFYEYVTVFQLLASYISQNINYNYMFVVEKRPYVLLVTSVLFLLKQI